MKPIRLLLCATSLCFVLNTSAAPVVARTEPRIFIGLTGTNELGAASTDQWPTSSRRLDGTWLNAAGVPQTTVEQILSKIPGRPVIVPVTISSRSPWRVSDPAVVRAAELEKEKLITGIETIVVNCDGAISSGQGDWKAGDIAKCRAQYSRPGRTIFMVVRGSNFNAEHQPVDDIVVQLIKKEADGVALEMSPFKLSQDGVYRSAFLKAWQKTKEYHKPFMWLAPVGLGEGESYLADLQKAWQWIEQNKIEIQSVIPINYGKMEKGPGSSQKFGDADRMNLPAVPESDAQGRAINSLTGAAYWLMQHPSRQKSTAKNLK